MKNSKVAILAALALTLGMAGQAFAASKDCQRDSFKLPQGTAVLAADPWSGYGNARHPDFMKASGYQYKYEEQLDQAKRACEMTSGHINFMATTLDQYLKHRPAGKIVGWIDVSLGADALALDSVKYPWLKSVDQLGKLVAEFKKQGKKPGLAYSADTPSDWLFTALANTHEELKPTDFNLIPVDQSSTAYAKLQSGEAQVAIIWEPDTSTARSAGYTVALSSKDVPDWVDDILVASDRVIADQPDMVQAVVNDFYRLRKQQIANPEEYKQFLVSDSGNPPTLKLEDTVSLLAGIKLYDAKESDADLNIPGGALDEPKIISSMQMVAGILALTDHTIVADPKMVDGRFVHKAAQTLGQ